MVRLVLAVTTYDRRDYLADLLESWNQTRNKSYDWTLIVADDGSVDGTLSYLRGLAIPDIRYYLLEHNHRGVHHQTNSIFRLLGQLDWDVCFKSDDDLTFLKSGWDDLYLEAIRKTGTDHLVFYDRAWGSRRKPREPEIVDSTGILSCATEDVQGAFWTLTPRVLEKVGYFDCDGMNLCGYGHQDYTYRCCRAGFNAVDHPYDVRDSNDYIRLVSADGYKSANVSRKIWNSEELVSKKKELLRDHQRVYIPLSVPTRDLHGKDVFHPEVSFVIPIRGRNEHLLGLCHNLKTVYKDLNYEIVFAYQDDLELFCRGQLCNLGFRFSRGDVVVFQDVDIRHFRPIDFVTEFQKHGRPFLGFDTITQVSESQPGKCNKLSSEQRLRGFGACSIFERYQFVKSSGFSNLIRGWGAEDNLLNLRVGFGRISQDLGHVQHPTDVFHIPLVDRPGYYHKSCWVLDTDHSRNPCFDGQIQTIAQETKKSKNPRGQIQFRWVEDIVVPTTFLYRSLFDSL